MAAGPTRALLLIIGRDGDRGGDPAGQTADGRGVAVLWGLQGPGVVRRRQQGAAPGRSASVRASGPAGVGEAAAVPRQRARGRHLH